jgi:hypothetical protein
MLAAASAGGLGLGGAIALGDAQATLQHLTLASNLAWTGKSPVDRLPGSGDQIWVATNGTVNIQNSILAGSGPSSTNDNVHGTITDGGYNISSDTTPAFTAASSRHGLNPMLGALTNNGGPTATMALLEGSPARDVIPALGAAAFDQRGFARPQGPFSDIGAFEVEVLNTLALAITRLGQSSVGIRFTAEDQRTYRLLRSTNLVDWEAAQTRAGGEAGPAEFIESDEEGNGRFFRVVTP